MAAGGRPRLSLQCHRNETLPRLAWCAKIARGSGAVVVEHGDWVETGEAFFAEGAWNRPVDDARMAEAEVMLGSGGAVSDGRIAYVEGCKLVHSDTTEAFLRKDHPAVGNFLAGFRIAANGARP